MKKFKYCPKCKTEYEDWAKVCGDCCLQLVNNLPPTENPQPPINYVKIFTTSSPSDMAFVKSVLSANNIQYSVMNENSSTYIIGPVGDEELMVREDEAEKAKEVLQDFFERKNKNT